MASPSLSGGNSAFPNYNATFAHIEDPNERRRRALAQIDTAPFGWRHARAVVVAGVGFFTDSYDIFAINLCSAMLGVVYWQTAATRPGKIPYSADTAVKVSTSAGTVVGQLLFGWLADRIGRKRMYGFELINHHPGHAGPGPRLQLALHLHHWHLGLLADPHGHRYRRGLPALVYYHLRVRPCASASGSS